MTSHDGRLKFATRGSPGLEAINLNKKPANSDDEKGDAAV
jgi:hypothetical protein